jgi:regulator of sirC expression with transglutaminase-like and TPR domain
LRPQHCRPEAFEAFVRAVEDLQRPDALVRAAIAMSMHETDADPEETIGRLDRLAWRVQTLAPSGLPRARLAWLHHVLFDEEGFRGGDGAPSPADSYLPSVLERRRGLPITLSLVYKALGDRLGLDVRGINAPGHFLASVDAGSGRMLVDAHGGGRVLTRDEAFRRMEESVGTPVQRSAALLLESPPRQWLARMLRNLEGTFVHERRPHDLRAMLEMRAVLLAPR